MERTRLVWGRRPVVHFGVAVVAVQRSGRYLRAASDLGLCGTCERAYRIGLGFCSFDARTGFAGVKRMRTITLVLLIALVFTNRALAHPTEPHAQVPAWSFDPWIVAPLLT